MTDPTNVIDTFDRAQVLARAMLRLAPDPALDIWQNVSEPVLATLLFAASPTQIGGGIAWVNAALAALAAGGAFTPGPGTPTMYAAHSLWVLRLDGRQRGWVIKTLRAAIEPWADAGHGARCA